MKSTQKQHIATGLNTFYFINLELDELENREWTSIFVKTSSTCLKRKGKLLKKTPQSPKNQNVGGKIPRTGLY